MCGHNATLVCPCRVTRYCGTKCQALHWRLQHKKACLYSNRERGFRPGIAAARYAGGDFVERLAGASGREVVAVAAGPAPQTFEGRPAEGWCWDVLLWYGACGAEARARRDPEKIYIWTVGDRETAVDVACQRVGAGMAEFLSDPTRDRWMRACGAFGMSLRQGAVALARRSDSYSFIDSDLDVAATIRGLDLFARDEFECVVCTESLRPYDFPSCLGCKSNIEVCMECLAKLDRRCPMCRGELEVSAPPDVRTRIEQVTCSFAEEFPDVPREKLDRLIDLLAPEGTSDEEITARLEMLLSRDPSSPNSI